MAYEDFYGTDGTKGTPNVLGERSIDEAKVGKDHHPDPVYDDPSMIKISNLGKMTSVAENYGVDEDMLDTWYVSVFTSIYMVVVGILIPPFGLYMLYKQFRKIMERG